MTEAAPNTQGRRRRRRRLRVASAMTAGVVVVVGAFFLTTAYTGFPGPGAMRRYPVADLDELAQRINTTCGTGDSVASVDRLRSRVHVDGRGVSPDRGRQAIAFTTSQERALTDYPAWGAVAGDCTVPARGDPMPPPMACGGMCAPPGAAPPTTLSVICTVEGPLLDSDTVQVGPQGVHVEYRNPTDVSTNVMIGSDDGFGAGTSGHLLGPGQSAVFDEATPPGRATVGCGQTRATASTASVALVDPNGYYGVASLDLQCGGGGQAVVDLASTTPVPSAEAGLERVLSADALADHDVTPSGYVGAEPRNYAVQRDGVTVAVAGYQTTPGGLLLVELHACSAALLHR